MESCTVRIKAQTQAIVHQSRPFPGNAGGKRIFYHLLAPKVRLEYDNHPIIPSNPIQSHPHIALKMTSHD